MAKKDAAAKTTDQAGEQTAAKASDSTAEKPADKPRRKALTNAQLIAAYKAQGGKCYVTGADLGDDTADIDGKLVTNAVKKYAGQRGLEDLRTKLAGDLYDARDLIAAFGKLANDKGIVTFVGEAAKNADEKGAQ